MRRPRRPDPAPTRLVLLALAAGFALEIGLRGGAANVVVAAGLALVVAALVTDRRLPQRSARWTALIALLPIAALALWTSAWLVWTNALVAALLLTAAVVFARSGSLLDTTLGVALRRALLALPDAWNAPRLLEPLVPRVSDEHARRAGRVGLATLVCVPILVIVVALLASADPVFASLLTPDIGVAPTATHLVFALFLALATVCVVGATAADHDDPPPAGTFGVTETVTMLALTAAVLGLFVVAQLVALTDAGDRLVAEAGLTPAEYARSGFFQLCWATALLVGLLALIRWLAAPDVRRATPVRVLAALVPLLATGLVVVSLRRLALYDAAFGLTMLRVWVAGAAVWMGLVLVIVSARNAGLGEQRRWVAGASLLTLVGLTLVADVANPEAFVVRHNLDRLGTWTAEDASTGSVDYRTGEPLDGAYLASLSDDAVPAIADALLATNDPVLAEDLRLALRCDEADPVGTASLNLAARRASSHRRAACAASDPG